MNRTAAALIAAQLLHVGCFGHDYRSKPRVAVVDGDPIVQMSKPGRLQSLDDPRYVPFRQHSDPPFRDERVLGVDLGAPRMYPIGLLDDYEVINDAMEEVPYVVARCALTDFVGVLDRRVAGRTLTFENSGALWRDMLVLRDRETGTYWTPATGMALSGPLEGHRLAILPASFTTAEAWEELLPETVCLETGDLSAVPLRLELYARSSWQGVSGAKTQDARFPPKERVFFVAESSEAIAFTSAQLRKHKSVSVRLGDRTFSLEWDPALRTPRAYRIDPASAREERPVNPIYWFALVRQFPAVRTLSEVSPGS